MRRGWRGFTYVAVIGVAIAGGVAVLHVRPNHVHPTVECVVTGVADPLHPTGQVRLTPQQADNAATIAAVGVDMGMSDHAVTVALAAAMQESKLIDLEGGDRDSAGLFQERPSQGWGTHDQVVDPVYASTAFYRRLNEQPGWADLSVTAAAQLVEQSAAPEAYAQWEQPARATAAALTGEAPAALTCHNIDVSKPIADVTSTAAAELGTPDLRGVQTPARGWAIGSWLVAHAARLGIDEVAFDGLTWTATSGIWSKTGEPDATLSFHQVSP